jgi:hypothetical protein
MTQPTPAPSPDVNNTENAETESGSPAFGGNDPNFSEQETDPGAVDPTTQPPIINQPFFNTDTGEATEHP